MDSNFTRFFCSFFYALFTNVSSKTKPVFLCGLMIFAVSTIVLGGDVTVSVGESTAAPLDNAAVQYRPSGSAAWSDFGVTNSGQTSLSLPNGNYDFKADYNGTTAVKAAQAVTAAPVTLQFYTTKVTIHVLDNTGTNGISNVALDLSNGVWVPLGNTDGSGQIVTEIFPKTNGYSFRATYNGTDVTVPEQIAGDGFSQGKETSFNFYTTGVEVKATTCNAAGVGNVVVQYSAGTWFDAGFTLPAGSLPQPLQLFPGTRNFKATYNGTSETQSVIIPGDGATTSAGTVISFGLKSVSVYSPWTAEYSGGTWQQINGTAYMFAGTYTFRFNQSHYTQIQIATTPCQQNIVASVLRLKDHNGNPLPGGTARGGIGNNFGAWFVDGSTPTDANGNVLDIRNLGGAVPGDMSYEMKFNNTTSVKKQDVTQKQIFEFQTNEVKLALKTCTNAPLPDGTARWGNGTTSSTYYFPGTNKTDANGEMAAEMFDGTYSFEMNYQISKNVKSAIVISGDTTLTWETISLTIKWPYDVSYGGTGDSRLFTKPSMNLLHGDQLVFNFRTPASSPIGSTSNYMTIKFEDCDQVLTPGIAVLLDSKGDPINGGVVTGYQGSWAPAYSGATGDNGNGRLLILGPQNPNPTSLQISYNGTTEQRDHINFTTNPVVVFQTIGVTIRFMDSHGNLYNDEGRSLEYYSGGFRTFGAGTTASGEAFQEMLRGNGTYAFGLTYLSKRQQISWNIVNDPVVVFQTVLMQLTLKDACNNPGIGIAAQYFAGNWLAFGTTDNEGKIKKELLPGIYSFNMGPPVKQQHDNVQVPGSTAEDVFQVNDCSLPIVLIDFRAEVNNGSVILKWSTATEQNNRGFDVERSNDGQSWQRVAHVATKATNGNTVATLDYQATDNNPDVGVNYYRLRQTDLDGKSTLSDIRAVSINLSGSVILYPNPVRSSARIRGVNGNEVLKIYDASGRMVQNVKVTQNEMTLHFDQLAQGVYTIQIISHDGRTVKTITLSKTE